MQLLYSKLDLPASSLPCSKMRLYIPRERELRVDCSAWHEEISRCRTLIEEQLNCLRIGSLLGATRQTPAIKLKAMIANGAISLRYGSITIDSMSKLKAMEAEGK